MELATIFLQLLISIITLITLVGGIVVMYFYSRAATVTREATLVAVSDAKTAADIAAAKADEVASNIKTIEAATNGMKDALVLATAKVAFDAGAALAGKKEPT